MKVVNTNVWIGIGRIGQDLELKETKNGQKQVMFSLAVNEDYTDKNGKEQKLCNWVPCVAYGAQAENLSKYKKKGDLILVEGAITVREGEDKNGNKRNFVNVRVKNTEWLPSGSNTTSSDTSQDNQSNETSDNYEPYAALDEDIF
jgi:single-strand DNA-binding protein